MCRLHGGGGTQVAGWETTPAPSAAAPTRPRSPNGGIRPGTQYGAVATAPPVGRSKPAANRLSRRPAEKPKEKKGFFGKIKDIFK